MTLAEVMVLVIIICVLLAIAVAVVLNPSRDILRLSDLHAAVGPRERIGLDLRSIGEQSSEPEGLIGRE